MDTAIAVTKPDSFSDLRLTRSATGHVHSFWFSFPQTGVVDYAGYQYQSMKQASISAFAELLGIDKLDVIVTERIDPNDAGFERWWRLGTKKTCALPAPQRKALDVGIQAINI